MTTTTVFTPLTPRFDEALAFAAHLHRRQPRKSTTIPYVSHVLAVAGIVLEAGGDEDEAIAALLHDAIEDQGYPGTDDEILRRFGPRVLDIVRACSDGAPGMARDKSTWRTRKEEHIQHLRGASPSARLVSAADKLHNARAIVRDVRNDGPSVWARFNAPVADIGWYYQSLCAEFERHGPVALARELRETVDTLHTLAAGAKSS